MYSAEWRIARDSDEENLPSHWLGLALCLFLAPFLGFMYLAKGRLAFLYFLYGLGLGLLIVFLLFLDLPELRNTPYGLFYVLAVNAVGMLHSANVHLEAPIDGIRPLYSRLVVVISIPVVASIVGSSLSPYLIINRMPGPAMAPSIPISTGFFVNRLAYEWSEPEAGEIVMYRSYSEFGPVSRISRIIGMPGDEVGMTRGIPSLNGVPIPRQQIEDFVYRDGVSQYTIPCYMETLPNGTRYSLVELDPGGGGRYDNRPAYKVPPASYYVISDNRDTARDSRDMLQVGFIKREDIIGRVVPLQMTPDSRWKWQSRLAAVNNWIGSISPAN